MGNAYDCISPDLTFPGQLEKHTSDLIMVSVLRHARQLGVRYMHQVADIGLAKNQGLPGLFSKKGLDLAWFDYQHHLVTELNKALAKRPELEQYDNLASLSEACLYSGDPKLKPVAALAAQAYTNEFFFRSLKKDGSTNPDAELGPGNPRLVDVSNEVRNMPPHPEVAAAQGSPLGWNEGYAPSTQQPTYPAFRFLSDVSSFGSISTFRELFITRGDAMFGNGAVWLVKNENSAALLNTYGWGTPFSSTEPQTDYDMLASTSSPLSVTPVFCVNLWEHIYLHDYSPQGKRQFLINTFDCIDWNVIDDRLSPPL